MARLSYDIIYVHNVWQFVKTEHSFLCIYQFARDYEEPIFANYQYFLGVYLGISTVEFEPGLPDS